jgi:hypothetical protein
MGKRFLLNVMLALLNVMRKRFFLCSINGYNPDNLFEVLICSIEAQSTMLFRDPMLGQKFHKLRVPPQF